MSLSVNNEIAIESNDDSTYNHDIESNVDSTYAYDIESNEYAIVELPNVDFVINNFNNAIRVKCIKICLYILLFIIVLSVTIGDFVFGYTDTSCIYIYPDNFGINMKQYLLTYAYINIILLSYNIFILCFYIKSLNELIYSNLLKLFTLDIMYLILKIFLIIWNIIGICIFWGLFLIDKCSYKIFNYLLVTIIIKSIISLTFYCETNNVDL